jgi:hypothetical protein
MFKTARFKIHNPSRHKTAMIECAMRQYHLTLKQMVEAVPERIQKITKFDKKQRPGIDKAALSRIL